MTTIESFKENIATSAENLVYNVFPDKAKQMDSLLSNAEFELANLSKLRLASEDSIALPLKLINHENKESKVPKLTSKKQGDNREINIKIQKETIGANKVIENLVNQIRPELMLLMEACNTIRVWVTLLLPKMQDGNNFGVSVQEEIMGEIKGVEAETASFFEQISTYFLTRAKVASKVVKHPRIYDYGKFVVEEDEKQFVNLRHVVAELRNFYTSLHDLIDKNIDKIKKPRNENHSSMY